MSDADLVIINGLNLESSMEKVANEIKNKSPMLQLLKLGDNTITEDQWIFDFSFPKERGYSVSASLVERGIYNKVRNSYQG